MDNIEFIIESDECIKIIKENGLNWIDNMLDGEITLTKPGSISYLLRGATPSEQSINIKMGRFGEFLAKELIKSATAFELLQCGIQQINDRKKDVDLLFKNELTKTIYYRELKGNIELDTEKLPATIAKCKEIETSLNLKYPDYSINCAVLNWSVYDRKILKAGLSNIKSFENGGIKIDHIKDILDILDLFWTEEDFYGYFREIGYKISSKFD